MASKCKLCGEQMSKTGNYTLRIIPAKRIPKKAKKLMIDNESSKSTQEQSSSWGVTKFQTFLLKRAKPANFMELTCGKCGGVSKIRMYKKLDKTNDMSHAKMEEGEISSIDSGQSDIVERSNLTKKRKDKSAGLTVPPTASTSSLIQDRSSRPAQPGKVISNAKRQRELENLNKMLFKSKKAKKSGSTLQDFLSGI